MKKCFKWGMFNVVWYDGVSAYVTKFVCKVNDDYEITKESKLLVQDYLDGNGEILKFDYCYEMEWENILAYKDNVDCSIYQRFVEMWL